MSGGIRAATIPNNVKKMIQNIKDVTGNHTDDEIYAMLKECSMDPNETAQKLLHQDTFHEVKRRKDRKKESQTNREIVDSRWRPGTPGRGGRGGRGFSSRYVAQDARNGRNTSSGKDKEINQASDKSGSVSYPPQVHEGSRNDKESSVTDMANGPIGVLSGGTEGADASVVPGGGTNQGEMSPRPRSRSGGVKRSNLLSAAKAQPVKATTFSGVCSSASDSVLLPSSDTRGPAVGTIKRAVGSQRSLVEPSSNVPTEADIGNLIQGKMGGKSQNQAVEFLQSSSLGHGISSSSRPLSNYGNRSQQAVASQKGQTKEWKPKPTNVNSVQEPKVAAESEATNVFGDTSVHSQQVERVINSKEGTNHLQQKPEQKPESLNVRDAQNVIIPDHIHVPEAVRTGLSFGSFDAALVVAPRHSIVPDEDLKSVSVAHQGNENAVVGQAVSDNLLTPAEEPDHVPHSQAPEHADNSSSADVSVPSSSMPSFSDSKETATDHQSSIAHTPVTYSFGLVPPVLGNPLGQMESVETQAHDVSRAPGFVVQQQVDPSSFYAQFYRPGSDSDGRVSPFSPHGVASKHSGNVTALSSQTSQSPPEGASALGFSTAAQTPLGTQAAGVMPSSIPVTQQPLPLFRQPAGIHLPHYPPNFIPYGHYFSPFYVPPPAMHQFLGNNAFAQQAQAGGVYPPPPNAAAAPTGVKFPLAQYKPGSNVGNSAHMGIGGGYGPYGASPAGFNPGTAATAGNTTANEDLAAAQFKESLYINGQQTEGSAVWFHGPGRDISTLPPNAFYNLPQGQHVTFAPTQAGQGAYAGIFHPAQGVTAAAVHPLLQQSQGMPGPVDMAGATANVYQQPQHAQMNWPNNY